MHCPTRYHYYKAAEMYLYRHILLDNAELAEVCLSWSNGNLLVRR